VIALAILLYVPRIGSFLGVKLGLTAAFETVWSLLRWAVLVAVLLIGFLLVSRFAPHLSDQRFWWIAPETAVAMIL